MSDIDQFKGTPFDERNTGIIPGSLKTLTVLTFIGCGILLLLTLINSVNAKKGIDAMEKMQGSDQLEKMPEFFKKFYSPEAMELARISYENRIPLTIIGMVGLGLCIFGAIQMRSLQKQGYFLWLIGNILPIIGNVIFVGTAALTGFGSYLFIGIFILFLILYSTQLKYLK
jgi:hypothetical protein